MGPALMSNLTDLLSRCQHRDQVAFDELFNQYLDRLYHLALAVVRDEKDAEDVVQETLLRVYRKIGEYRAEASFNTWLTTIAVNVCRDHLRRQKLRRAISLEWLRERPDHNQPGVLDQVDQHLQDQALWRLVDRLDDRYRLPLLLVYRENMPAAQAAQVLGLPLRTLYARLQHAYAWLGDQMQPTPAVPAASLDGEQC